MAAGEKIRNEDLGEIWKGNKKRRKITLKRGKWPLKCNFLSYQLQPPTPAVATLFAGEKNLNGGGGVGLKWTIYTPGIYKM